MNSGLCAVVAAAAALAADVDVSKLPAPALRQIDFARDIKPIFETACFRCHGTERPKSRFSLATRQAALKGGDNGIDIIPGDSAKSPLIHYVAGLVPDMEMPPAGKAEPLTREQVATLRAWIDQGSVWEEVDSSKDYAVQFSAAPAVRWIGVDGNARKFQEHHWVRRGFSGGASEFRIAQKFTNGIAVAIEGRALTDDYKMTLDLRKEDVGHARFGFEEFRHYYDDSGAYYPFQASGFATQTRNIFRLDRDLHLDTGRAFAEFGLSLPGLPQALIGYEYHFKNGDQSTLEWGPVNQRNTGGVVTKHIYPAYKNINEDVHVLRLDVSHDIGGTRVEDNVRAEFSDLKTKRVADVTFPSGQLYPTEFRITREAHDQTQIANTLRGERSFNDWLFASAGYLFSHFDADAALSQDNRDGAGRLTAGRFWSVNDITLSEQAHVFNVNTLAGPWNGFTLSAGVMNEWMEQHGFGTPNYQENVVVSIPPTNRFGFVASTTDQLALEESAALRYTSIPATVLFAEARLRQERRGTFEEENGEQDFLRDTDTAMDRQEYKGGFEISPWRWASLNSSYKHRVRDSDYDHNLDAHLPRTTNQTYLEFIQSGDGYPAFIGAREIREDVFETRMMLRPSSWLRTTLSYQLSLSDYRVRTDSAFLNETNLVSPGGRIFAGEQDSSTYSLNVTMTPWRRWMLSTTLSYQESRTWTEDHTNGVVAPYRGDTFSVAASSTFALTMQTDLTGGYSFSRSRFAQDNAAKGLPLGIDYDLHSLQFGIAHRFTANVAGSVQYGFFKYDEPSARGFNDYTAHMVFGMITVRLP